MGRCDCISRETPSKYEVSLSASSYQSSLYPLCLIHRLIHPSSPPQHKPGVKASPKDEVQEFEAKTLPPGSAPPGRTFKPRKQAEVPSQANNDATFDNDDVEETYTSAADTLGGATSADVNKGMGRPMQGETSTEMHHDGRHKRKKERDGLIGVARGGSGLRDEGNVEVRRLSRDDNEHGPRNARQHNEGAEDKAPAREEDVVGKDD
jgi:hypothetical protein